MGNPFLGVVFHWLGGLASGSFYVPYRGVKKWSWETYWLVGGVFSWIICPWLLAFILTNDLSGVLKQQSLGTLWWTYFFGAMWGFGGLTFGLTMRYLGMSLGMGVALGYCAAFGTLVPPIFKQFMPSLPVGSSIGEIARSTPGQVTLAGVAICLLGIGVAALAGLTKEREMPEEQKRKVIAEFNFKKGILVATFSGIMSACFSFALTAGNPIGAAAAAAGTATLWTGLPKLCVVLAGGFTTNCIWCLLLNLKNRTGYEYFASHVREEHAHHGGVIGSEHGATSGASFHLTDLRIPAFGNYLFSALAGTCWYFQFFFYTMGETQMGKFSFASWTLHMASIIIFSTMWGWIFHEWKGSSKKAHLLIGGGIVTLILSTIVIGYGTYAGKSLASQQQCFWKVCAWDENDLAVRHFQNRKFPSWGYEVEQGATTIWERWNSYTKKDGFGGEDGKQNASMNSFDHYSFGAVCEWMLGDLAGIQSDGPGYERIIIYPHPAAPGSNPSDEPIHWVKAHNDSIHGRITSNWQRAADQFVLETQIPANTTATIYLPATMPDQIRESGKSLVNARGVLRMEGERAVLSVESGSYRFVVNLSR